MICCVTGHRPEGFLFPRDETDLRYTEYLKKLQADIKKLTEMGCDIFITGMADGADMVYAIWNGKESGGTWNTIRYARSKGKSIRYLMLAELIETGNSIE